MLKKLLVAVFASAFAFAAYAPSASACDHGEKKVASEKKEADSKKKTADKKTTDKKKEADKKKDGKQS